MIRFDTALVCIIACVVEMSCATAPGPEAAGDESGPDAGTRIDASSDNNGDEPDAGQPGETQTLSATNSFEVINGNSVACMQTADSVHYENHYYRVFDLAAHGVTSTFEVVHVEFGVEVATAGSGTSQNATLNLFSLDGDIESGSRVSLDSSALTVSDMSLELLGAPMSATVPDGSKLLVELITPDGRTAGHSLVPGSNQSGEQSPTYLQADDCSVSSPTPAGSSPINRPEMHWVVNVTGF